MVFFNGMSYDKAITSRPHFLRLRKKSLLSVDGHSPSTPSKNRIGFFLQPAVMTTRMMLENGKP